MGQVNCSNCNTCNKDAEGKLELTNNVYYITDNI